MSTKHTITFKRQRNGKLQVIYDGEIELVDGDDAAELGQAVLQILELPPQPESKTVTFESEVCDREEFESAQTEQTFAGADAESHVRAAIEEMMPGGSRILDFLQTVSSKDGTQ